MMNNFDDKVYFKPGDLVKLKQDIPYKPIMLVHRIERNMIKSEDNLLRGIKCRWFTENGHLEEAIFSTKDLQLI